MLFFVASCLCGRPADVSCEAIPGAFCAFGHGSVDEWDGVSAENGYLAGSCANHVFLVGVV